MKVFYSCYGGAHTSVIAAAIHLGILPTDTLPTCKMLMEVPHYDVRRAQEIGLATFMGIDEFGNEIYVVGMGPKREACAAYVYDLVTAAIGSCYGALQIVNSIALINNYVRIGGFISKQLLLSKIGKPLTAYGIQRNYFDYVALVKSVKENLSYYP